LTNCQKANVAYVWDKAHIVWEADDRISGTDIVAYRSITSSNQLDAIVVFYGDGPSNPSVGAYQNSAIAVYHEKDVDIFKEYWNGSWQALQRLPTMKN